MRTIKLACILIFTTTIAACTHHPTVEELKKFAATEVYPEDSNLDTIANKKALIIVAHDDDDCMMSGTIAKLTANGWTIKQLSFEVHPVPGEERNPAGIICAGSEIILEDGLYRPGKDTVKYPYMPIPLKEIEKQYLREKVAAAVVAKVNDFNPSVLFTLDNLKGGYGHPDHIFLSQLVFDLFTEGTIGAQWIYQSVLTNHVETAIDQYMTPKMEKWGYPQASLAANAIYGIDGMPEPDVQVTITSQAEIKMAYLRAYPGDVRKNLRKFLIYYEDFDAETYFSVWDREFFRVIKK